MSSWPSTGSGRFSDTLSSEYTHIPHKCTPPPTHHEMMTQQTYIPEDHYLVEGREGGRGEGGEGGRKGGREGGGEREASCYMPILMPILLL